MCTLICTYYDNMYLFKIIQGNIWFGSASISLWKKIHPTLDRIFHKKKTKINQKCTTPLIFSFAINHIKHEATL